MPPERASRETLGPKSQPANCSLLLVHWTFLYSPLPRQFGSPTNLIPIGSKNTAALREWVDRAPRLTDAGETPVTWSPSPASCSRRAVWDQGVALSRPALQKVCSPPRVCFPVWEVSCPPKSPPREGPEQYSGLQRFSTPSPWNCKAQPCRPAVLGFPSLGVQGGCQGRNVPSPTPVRAECHSHCCDSEPQGRHLQPPWVMLWGHVKLNICS